MRLVTFAPRATVWVAVGLAAALGAADPIGAQRRPRIEKARVELLADRESYAAGSAARVAARFEVDEGWHIQSHTPSFDYLIPTELELSAPEGWQVGEPSYPSHEFWTAEFEDEPLAV